MHNHNYCVILAGGTGSRFWPISREAKPKQFIAVSQTGRSFLKMAWDRVARSIAPDHILVVTLSRYREMVREQLPDILEENILAEPYGRNTAPAILLAAMHLHKRDPEAVMLVTPADHVIPDHALFDGTVQIALETAAEEKDGLYTLGVVPTRPDTNFGYIQVSGGSRAVAAGGKAKSKSFMEKPDIELAKVFVESGEFLWNTGIFIWRADTILAELEKHASNITSLFDGLDNVIDTPYEAPFLEKAYADCPKISIDYAVMEKSDKVWIFPGHFRWADIGNWESLFAYLSRRDNNGNAIQVRGKTIIRDCDNDFIYSTGDERLIILRGLDDFLVVDTEDVLMICPRDDRKVKETISEIGMPEYQTYK